jgi:hypothetical protein
MPNEREQILGRPITQRTSPGKYMLSMMIMALPKIVQSSVIVENGESRGACELHSLMACVGPKDYKNVKTIVIHQTFHTCIALWPVWAPKTIKM